MLATFALPLIPRRSPQMALFLQGLTLSLGVLALLVFSLASLSSIRSGDSWLDWLWFWVFTGLALALSSLILVAVWSRRTAAPSRDETGDGAPALSVRALRDALVTGDAALAPALLLPTPLQEDDVSAPPTTLHVAVRRAEHDTTRGEFVAALIPLSSVLLVGLPGLMRGDAWAPLYLRVFYALMIVVTLWRVGVIAARLRPRQVTITTTGLTWRGAFWRTEHLSWGEVRGWGVVFLPPAQQPRWQEALSPSPHAGVTAIYALQGEQASLTWLYPLLDPTAVTFRGEASVRRNAERQQASQTLARITHAHTAVPLRDLTPALDRLRAQVERLHGQPRQIALNHGASAAEGALLTWVPVAALLFVCSVGSR